MYAPESPAQSEHSYAPDSPAQSEIADHFERACTMYEPDSPAAHSEIADFFERACAIDTTTKSECVYEPESPMKRNNAPTTGLLQQIMNDIKTSQKCEILIRKYIPIHAWKSYVKLTIIEEKKKLLQAKQATEDVPYNEAYKKEYINRRFQYEKMKLQMTEVSWNQRKMEERKSVLKSTIAAWRDACPTPRRIINEKISMSTDYFRTLVKLAVDEKGHVNVKIFPSPLINIHEKYFQKFQKPPFEEYTKVLLEVGYPIWFVNRMIKRHKPCPVPKKTVLESLQSKDFKTPKSKKPVSTLKKFISK